MSLTKATFNGATMVDTSFLLAKLTNTTFDGAKLTNTTFNNATMTKTAFFGATMTDTSFDQRTNLIIDVAGALGAARTVDRAMSILDGTPDPSEGLFH